MSAAQALLVLEAAEAVYLVASGWDLRGGLWCDPQNPHKGHVDRRATYIQRQRDTAADNARRAEVKP